MARVKVVFIDVVHPALADALEAEGFQCDMRTNDSKEEIAADLHQYKGLVIRSRFPLDEEFLSKGVNLKFIARSGAGMENIDTDYARSKGIKCLSAPAGNMDAVAEHALAMILCLFNKLMSGHRSVQAGKWDRDGHRSTEMMGQTVGILGYGLMGGAFARRLTGLGVDVIAYDKYKHMYGNKYAKEVSLETFFRETDILSIHLPLTEETEHMIDTDFLNRFAKPIYVINTARGKNVKTDDLVDAMESGKVLGACLDVLEYEKSCFERLQNSELPAAFNYLANSPDVVLSPHVAGWSHESYVKLSLILADKIRGLSSI